jgi:hypothetical protein
MKKPPIGAIREDTERIIELFEGEPVASRDEPVVEASTP